jgi:hypothetical protein
MMAMVAPLLLLARDLGVEVGEPSTDADGVVHVPLRSSAQSKPVSVRLLAPKGPAKAWLYVLPVEAEGDAVYGDGLAEARKLGLHEKHGWVLVAPGFARLPWYADHPTDAARRDETHLLKAVLPLVEKRHPLAKPVRLLLGFSKSGWGAWSLLLRHPELFDAAAAWDSPFMEEKPEKYGMGPAFGTQENFERYRIERLLRAAPPDRKRLAHLGYGNFRGHHRKLQALLEELRVPVEYRDGPRRPHAWGGGWLEDAAAALAGLVR